MSLKTIILAVLPALAGACAPVAYVPARPYVGYSGYYYNQPAYYARPAYVAPVYVGPTYVARPVYSRPAGVVVGPPRGYSRPAGVAVGPPRGRW